MRYSGRDRGSAFIMVIGVMAALAMIGSVFFLITIADKKESAAQLQAAPMANVIDSEIRRIQDALAADLYIGANGPYSDTTVAAFNWNDPYKHDAPRVWRRYIDYASADVGNRSLSIAADCADPHLASTELLPAASEFPSGANADKGAWAQITNLVGYPPEMIKNVSPNQNTFTFDVNGIDGIELPDERFHLVDADGDDVYDSILYPTGSCDNKGERYYAAVRIVDLSAMVNVNTAYRLEKTRLHWDPVQSYLYTISMPSGNVELGEICRTDGATTHDSFPADEVPCDRSGGGGGDVWRQWMRHNYEAARRVENPAKNDGTGNPYRLYDWSDELSCRWRGDGSVSPSMASSRLGRWVEDNTIGTTWPWYSKFLTTASSGRILHGPNTGNSTRALSDAAKVEVNLPLDNDEQRKTAYIAYRNAFYQILAGSDDRETEAAQLAVNLIDFRDGDDKPTLADVSGDRVIGVERQPYVTMAWYWTKMILDPLMPTGTTSFGSEMLIVLHNPYDEAIDMTNWKVVTHASKYNADGITVTPAAVVTYFANKLPVGEARRIPKGGRLVIRTPGVADTAVVGPYRDLVVNMNLDEIVWIIRPAHNPFTGLDTEEAVVARFKWSDYGYDPGDSSQPENEYTVGIVRDDMPETHRMSIARYASVATPKDYSLDVVNRTINNYNVSIGLQGTDAVAYDGTMSPAITVDDLPAVPVFNRGHNLPNGNPGPTQSLISVGELSRLLSVGPTVASDPIPVDMVLSDALDKVEDYLATLPLAPGPVRDQFRKDMKKGIGRLDSRDFLKSPGFGPDGPAGPGGPFAPALPAMCLAADYFVVDGPLYDYEDAMATQGLDNDGDGYPATGEAPDPASLRSTYGDAAWNREMVVHGRININTATKETLCTLPLLPDIAGGSPTREEIAKILISYRDLLGPDPDWSNLSFSTVPRKQYFPYEFDANEDLRNQPGFAAAGEAGLFLSWWTSPSPFLVGVLPPVVPVDGQFVADNGGDGGYSYRMNPGLTDADATDDVNDGYLATSFDYADPTSPTFTNDLTIDELRYTYVSNHLAVNSDTYCAYIWIQKGPDPTIANLSRRRYIAIFDRSNCYTDTDRPIVRALAEVK